MHPFPGNAVFFHATAIGFLVFQFTVSVNLFPSTAQSILQVPEISGGEPNHSSAIRAVPKAARHQFGYFLGEYPPAVGTLHVHF